MKQSAPLRQRASALIPLLVALALSLAATSALAQAASGRQQAQVIFKKGQALYDEGRFVEAGIEFLTAYQLDPHPAIMYNVARAHEEQGKLVNALQYYRVALGLKPSEAVKEELDRKIAELELILRADGVDVLNLDTAAWVPKGSLTVQSEPPGAEVIINGQSAGTTPINGKVLPQGEYSITVRRRGFRAEERALTVVGGKTYVLSPRLTPGSDEDPALKVQPGMIDVSAPQRGLMVFVDGEPVATTPVGQLEVPAGLHTISVEGKGFPTYEERVEVVSGQTARIVARRPGPIIVQKSDEVLVSQSGWGWIVTGAGAGAVGFGGLMGALALSDADTYNADRGAPLRAQVREDAIFKGIVADVSYGAGLALLVTGALLITFDEGVEAEEPPVYGEELVWQLGPQLLPGGAGVGAGASW